MWPKRRLWVKRSKIFHAYDLSQKAVATVEKIEGRKMAAVAADARWAGTYIVRTSIAFSGFRTLKST
jgi:hypothetical protein